MEVDSNSRDFKVTLWIVGALEALKGLKLISGGVFRITPKGVSEFDQVDAELKPTNEEIIECLPAVVIASGDDDNDNDTTSDANLQMMIGLTIRYRDNRDTLISAAKMLTGEQSE